MHLPRWWWAALLCCSCSAAAEPNEDRRDAGPDCQDACWYEGLCKDRGVCSCDNDNYCTNAQGIELDPFDSWQCCYADSAEACSASAVCELDGRCSLGAGVCYAASDYDCARSLTCSNLGNCFACSSGSCGQEPGCE